ncbi:MAG: CehA/McbA family metallohydrolase [Streptosporangiaceae bacterium]
MSVTRHRGRWTQEDRCTSPYHYLPVAVPPGSAGLRVALDFDRSAAVLDLGCFGPAGFRGWSGGARSEFIITAGQATPGYLPGELEPGEWQVVLGLYQLPAAGASYTLTAEVTSAPGRLGPAPPPAPPAPLTSRPPRRDLPARPGHRWLAGDLHTHTVHSDGALTVPQLARLAAEQGLDFLAITDHNTVSHHAELGRASARYGVTLIPGQEVTTDTGHAGALGDLGWVDFREPADSWLAAAERGGGLLSVNHPLGGHVSWIKPMQRKPPLVEVWHWSWLDPRWTAPLAWWLAWDPAAVPVGGSDWHRPGSDAVPGTPTTWVECAGGGGSGDGPGAVLAGLRAGRCAISAGRDGPVLLRLDGEFAVAGGDGTTLAGPNGPRALVRGDLATFPAAPGCHRLLDPAGGTLALTG